MQGFYYLSLLLSLATFLLACLLQCIVIDKKGDMKSRFLWRFIRDFFRDTVRLEYSVSITHPVFRVQMFQVLSAAVITAVGAAVAGVTGQFKCQVMIALYGLLFGINVFSGYCFALVKALAVDAVWRKSHIKEILRGSTSLSVLLALFVPRFAPGKMEEGVCTIDVRRNPAILMTLLGILIDIVLKVSFAVLFAEPLWEMVKVADKNGKQKSEKISQLIKMNFQLAGGSAVISVIGYFIILGSFVADKSQLTFYGSYFVVFANLGSSFVSTRSAWRKPGAQAEHHGSAGSSANLYGSKGGTTQRKEKSSLNREEKSEADNSSVVELEPASTKGSNLPHLDLQAAINEQEEVKEKPRTHESNSAGKKGVKVVQAVGRGGYAGVGDYGAGKYEVDVELKFDAKAAGMLLNVVGLDGQIPEEEVAALMEANQQAENAAAPIGRGVVIHTAVDTYVDPVFLQKTVAGGVSRGGGGGQVAPKPGTNNSHEKGKNGSNHVPNESSVSSTKSIPNAENGAPTGQVKRASVVSSGPANVQMPSLKNPGANYMLGKTMPAKRKVEEEKKQPEVTHV